MLLYEVNLSEKCHINIFLSVKIYVAESIVMFLDTLCYYMISVPIQLIAIYGKSYSLVVLSTELFPKDGCNFE